MISGIAALGLASSVVFHVSAEDKAAAETPRFRLAQQSYGGGASDADRADSARNQLRSRERDARLPKKAGVVAVGGHVNTPGKIDFTPGLTLAEALTHAGGISSRGSDMRIQVKRGEREMNIDAPGDEGGSFPLKPGDEILVPERSRKTR